MVSVCLYFQVHQPYRLKRYSVFDIGNNHDYFDVVKNRDTLKKVAEKCYLPANKAMLELIRKTDGKFRIAYSMTGVVLDQFEEYYPEVLDSFKELVNTGAVELLGETYFHSLSYLYSKSEFIDQVRMHEKKLKKLFNYKPTVFRNTELIFKNELAYDLENMGYKAVLAEGADHILGWRSPNFIYTPKTCKNIKLLLKNYRLSDDVAFRFSEKSWGEWPLTAPKFAGWVSSVNGNGNTVNLFMDYETFGEHQWADTGIFEFLKSMPHEILRHPHNNFKTPSEVVESYNTMGELDIHFPVSWADIERDLSAWLGNTMQRSAAYELYRMEGAVRASGDASLMNDWRKLQTSDHFYYMCTKWFNDGDVHKYFNPYSTPYDAFISFMNVLNDMRLRLNKKEDNNAKREMLHECARS